MIYYIKFDDSYRLVISAYENILPEYNYTPVRLKTLATINAFFVLLNYGNKIKPILEGYTLKVFIPYSIMPISDGQKFRNLIRKTRYNCYLNNIYCDIINKDNYGLYTTDGKDYIVPKILEEIKIISVNKFFFLFEEILDAVSDVEIYFNKLDVIKYEETQYIDNGGHSWLVLFQDCYSPDKDLKLMKLLGMAALACKKYGWNFCVKHTGFKHGIIVQIFRYEVDLYEMWSVSTKLGFTRLCINEANTIRQSC